MACYRYRYHCSGRKQNLSRLNLYIRSNMPRSRSRSRSPRRRRDYRDDRRDDDRERDRGYRRREYSRERDRERHREPPRRYDDRRSSRNVPGPSSSSRNDPGPSSSRALELPRPSKSKSKSKSRSPSPEPDKAKPNFKQSGLLAAETNTVRTADGDSTFLKYNEPPEARKPAESWRLYVFKGSEQVGMSDGNIISYGLGLIMFRFITYLSTKCISHRERPRRKYPVPPSLDQLTSIPQGLRHPHRTPVLFQTACCDSISTCSEKGRVGKC